MADDPTHLIIIDGDKIQITIPPPFVCPTLAQPQTLTATGAATVNDKKVCIVGDELPPSLKAPLQYQSGPYVTPGTGTVSVTLAASNKTEVSDDDDQKMILKGTSFQAKFEVTAPAMMPAPPGPPQPDPMAGSGYSGTAMFITTNTMAFSD